MYEQFGAVVGVLAGKCKHGLALLAHPVRATISETVESEFGLILLVVCVGLTLILPHWFGRLRRLQPGSLTLVGCVLILEFIVRTGLSQPAPIPAPSWVLHRLILIGSMPKFWEHTATSIARVTSGYSLALCLAIPLGVVTGWLKTLDRFIDPLLQSFRQVPQFALYPVFILFFGVGEFPKTLLIMLAAFWWIFLNTRGAVRDVDSRLIKIARSMTASRWILLTRVVLPPAVPTIITGMRYASTEVVLALMTVEMMGAQKGLGILIGTPHYWAILLFMTILGMIANYSLIWLERSANRGYESVN